MTRPNVLYADLKAEFSWCGVCDKPLGKELPFIFVQTQRGKCHCPFCLSVLHEIEVKSVPKKETLPRCPECLQAFIPTIKSQIFCSKRCSDGNSYKRRKIKLMGSTIPSR